MQILCFYVTLYWYLPKICLKWNISLLSMCSNLRFQDLHSLIISGPGGTKFSFQLKSNYNTQGPAEQSTYGSITGVELEAKIIEPPRAWGWQYNVFSVMINRKGVKLSGVKFGKRKLNAHIYVLDISIVQNILTPFRSIFCENIFALS